jgi:hypothetical protein
MPDTVKDRVHALARRANADKGLVFHDSDGNNLDIMYPTDAANDDDSSYDPEDDKQSYDSDDDVNAATNMIVTPTLDNAGVDDAAHDNDASNEDGGNDQNDEHQRTPGVNNETPGVHPGVNNETPGVNTETPMDTETKETPMDTVARAAEATNPGDLEDFVDALESELDAELAKIDSAYVPSDNRSSDDDPNTDVGATDGDEEVNMLGSTFR